MLHLADVKTLFDYNYWATRRILGYAAELAPEQFTAESGVYRASPRAVLAHMLGAERLWLMRWETGTSNILLRAEDITDVEHLRSLWAEQERAMRAFLETLDDAVLVRPVRFERRGAVVAYPLWQLMFQLINHATHHRSEVAAMLTAYGHSPGDLDFFLFVQPLSEGLS
jgi:uncharacterized damage-inducible protein DinB